MRSRTRSRARCTWSRNRPANASRRRVRLAGAHVAGRPQVALEQPRLEVEAARIRVAVRALEPHDEPPALAGGEVGHLDLALVAGARRRPRERDPRRHAGTGRLDALDREREAHAALGDVAAGRRRRPPPRRPRPSMPEATRPPGAPPRATPRSRSRRPPRRAPPPRTQASARAVARAARPMPTRAPAHAGAGAIGPRPPAPPAPPPRPPTACPAATRASEARRRRRRMPRGSAGVALATRGIPGTAGMRDPAARGPCRAIGRTAYRIDRATVARGTPARARSARRARASARGRPRAA